MGEVKEVCWCVLWLSMVLFLFLIKILGYLWFSYIGGVVVEVYIMIFKLYLVVKVIVLFN